MAHRPPFKLMVDDWWAGEAPTWAGKMGGCGNWDLAEARGYREAFVDRLMRTAEVEVNGRRYHPWSFYYSVSRQLVLERRRELAREIASKAPISLALAKRHLGDPQPDMAGALRTEAEAILRCMETEDWQEGLRAFAEGRRARFTGR